MELTITGEDKKQLKNLEDLERKMGLRVSRKKHTPSTVGDIKNQKSLHDLMSEIAASKAFKSIEDPVAWQREQRKDRPLQGREKQ